MLKKDDGAGRLQASLNTVMGYEELVKVVEETMKRVHRMHKAR